MWRRSYLLLLLVRLYFALSPSYLHPDENFQGAEVLAGELFPYPTQKTWEWTSTYPIRSVFPLWPVYGIPMTLLKWVWAEDDQGNVSPEAIYYALRIVMFILSFVLEDWAIYELVHSPRHRRQAVILVASSYVTWTYQSHTFSNSVETLLVAWGLVLIERIVREKNRRSILSCGILSFITVFGVFNRITFPAFIVIPGLQLLPHFFSRPLSVLSMTASALFFICLAIATDTAFYRGSGSTSLSTLYKALLTSPVITPWNSIRYNSQTSNLALHGLHPHYQHFLANLPQLLGPALILLFTSLQPLSLRSLRFALLNPRFLSAITGTAFLSVFPHQEPRFLLPCVPLLLTCIRLPTSTRGRKWFWTSWLAFNILLGTLMGTYHQGGVIPAQLQVPEQVKSLTSSSVFTSANATISATIFWWKTYPPPTYLLGNTAPIHISTVPLMGLPQPEMLSKLSSALPSTCRSPNTADNTNTPKTTTTTESSHPIFLIAPLSSPFFPPSSPLALNISFTVDVAPPTQSSSRDTTTTAIASSVAQQQSQEAAAAGMSTLQLSLTWTHRRHINLDDMDLADDGLWDTWARVVGRRGIGIWRVRRLCVGRGGEEEMLE